MWLYVGLIIGCLIGVVTGFLTAVWLSVQADKDAAKQGVIKIDGTIYRLVKMDT